MAEQRRASPALKPHINGTTLGHETPTEAVFLLDGQLQNVAGLLSLRQSQDERPGLWVFAAPAVLEDRTAGLPLPTTTS